MALQLRSKGLSYSEILEHVPVSHSSLSLWLRHIVLNPKQQGRLISKSRLAGARARHEQRLSKEKVLQNEVDKEFGKLINDPFFNLGLAMYWAEGSKQKPWHISARAVFANSNGQMILLMRRWFTEFGHFSANDFSYRLHIHESADIDKAKKKWAATLKIEASAIRVSIKHHEVVARHKHNDYRGLISLIVHKSCWFNRRIEMWTQAAARHYLKS